MNKKTYLFENAELKKQNRFLRFVVFLIAVAVVIQGFLVYRAGINQKIVLVPLYLEGESFVTGKDGSDAYLREMGSYVCYLRLNYAPSNVSKQFNNFLKLVDSSIFGKMQKSLYKIKEEVIQYRISSSFYPDKIEINRAKKAIFVYGKLLQWVDEKTLTSSERKIFAIKYKIESGRFYVVDFVGCGERVDECQI